MEKISHRLFEEQQTEMLRERGVRNAPPVPASPSTGDSRLTCRAGVADLCTAPQFSYFPVEISMQPLWFGE